jgi:hypothetical protein
MKEVTGVLLIVAGIAFGLYAGLWWAFIGGIVQVVEAVKATPVEAMDLALGIVRIVFAGAIGMITAVVAIFPGWAMLNWR